jgi:hypothetical protein
MIPSFTDSTRRRATTLIQCSPGAHSALVQILPHNDPLVECLFGDGQTSCILGQQGALEMDTGLLATNIYLAINVPPEGRLLLRDVVACSLMHVQDYPKLEKQRR